MEKAIIILIPLYFAYTIALGLVMFVKRFKAIKNKTIRLSYFRDYQGEVPQELEVYKNHFENQFQVPVIFMAACLAIALLKLASPFVVVLAYAFIISRLAHSYIHLINNNVRHRGLVYIFGALCVLGLWIKIAFSFY